MNMVLFLIYDKSGLEVGSYDIEYIELVLSINK